MVIAPGVMLKLYEKAWIWEEFWSWKLFKKWLKWEMGLLSLVREKKWKKGSCKKNIPEPRAQCLLD
jgi:hypothetical protein